jgi:hypothetical protein
MVNGIKIYSDLSLGGITTRGFKPENMKNLQQDSFAIT